MKINELITEALSIIADRRIGHLRAIASETERGARHVADLRERAGYYGVLIIADTREDTHRRACSRDPLSVLSQKGE